jgi:hypothetical protein
MRGGACRAALTALLMLGLAAPAHALSVAPFRGHVGIGYAKLFESGGEDPVGDRPSPPGGSLSAEGGFDYPIRPGLRLGASLGYHLLGSRNVPRGSLVASLDYSALTTAVQLHWETHRLGPVTRLSAGPAIFNKHIELSTSGGGAMFSDLARAETAAGAALDATLMPRGDRPVRVGFEIGTRIGFFADEAWTLATGRLVFHY